MNKNCYDDLIIKRSGTKNIHITYPSCKMNNKMLILLKQIKKRWFIKKMKKAYKLYRFLETRQLYNLNTFLTYVLGLILFLFLWKFKSKRADMPRILDFTYGTLLAGKNVPSAYTYLEQSLIINEEKRVNKKANLSLLRVGIFTDELRGIGTPGGIGYCVSELAFLLSKNGATVTIVFLGSGDPTEEMKNYMKKHKIIFVKLNPPLIKLESQSSILFKSYYSLLYLMQKNESEEFDVIHFNDYLGHGLLPLYAKRQGWLLQSSNIIVTLHGTSGWARFGNKVLPQSTFDISIDWIEKESISQADIVLAPSKFMASFASSRGVRMKNIVLMPNAPPNVPVTKSDQIFVDEEKDYKILEIVFFGRLEFRKGPFLFIEAVKIFAKSYPDITVCVIYAGKLAF